MEQQPDIEEEFELLRRRLVVWRRLGQSMLSEYKYLPDGSITVLVEDNHPQNGESYWSVQSDPDNRDATFNNPWDH